MVLFAPSVKLIDSERLTEPEPALELFEKDKMDPEMAKRFDQIIEKGTKAEMCQVSMKAFGKTIDNLAKGFVVTEHPVAVKRIADLQKEGYLYIKP